MNPDRTAPAASSNHGGTPSSGNLADNARGALVLAALVAAISLIGVLDHATGTELRIYPPYVVPIAIAAWKCGWPIGAAASLLAMVAWAGSNRLAGLDFPLAMWASRSVRRDKRSARGLAQALRARHARGVVSVQRLNARWNALGSENPSRNATSDKGRRRSHT